MKKIAWLLILVSVAVAGCTKPKAADPIPDPTPVPRIAVTYEVTATSLDGYGTFSRSAESISYTTDDGSTKTGTDWASTAFNWTGTASVMPGTLVQLQVNMKPPMDSWDANTKLTLTIKRNGVAAISNSYTPTDAAPNLNVQTTM